LSVGLDVISAEVDVSSNRRTLIVLAQPLEQYCTLDPDGGYSLPANSSLSLAAQRQLKADRQNATLVVQTGG
jgi:hypothetical protein